MHIRSLMNADPITVPPDFTMFDARRLMDERRIRHLLVTLAGELRGIVTDRDIRLNMPSQATSLSVWELNNLLMRLTVADVMTRTVVTVEPDRDAREAAEIMLFNKIGALPVIERGRLVGIVTETDLVRAFVGLAADTAGSPTR
jgi:acetoin utilization protein AcuB